MHRFHGKKGGRSEARKVSKAVESHVLPSKDSVPSKVSKKQVRHSKPHKEGDSESITAYNALVTLLSKHKKVESKYKKQDPSENQAPTLEKDQDIENLEGFDNEDDDDGDEEVDEDAAQAETELQEIDMFEREDTQDDFYQHFVDPKLPDQIVYSTEKYPATPSFGERSLLSTAQGVKTRISYPDSKHIGLSDLKVRFRLENSFRAANKKRAGTEDLTQLQSDLAKVIFQYKDILFPGKTYQNEAEIYDLSCLHILNHIFKTRDEVLRNSYLLNHPDVAAERFGEKAAQDMEYRDQGLTRPKVLVLLPTRNAAYLFAERLMDLSGMRQIENKRRFTESFKATSIINKSRPEDFNHLFGGNSSDMFAIGVKFTRQALKFYSSFYGSDLIIASPLALKLIVGNKNDKKRDYDFLSSIEILMMDQADALLMQSWSNVNKVLENLNITPKESHGCDFSRVRNYYLEEQSKKVRQTIIFSQYVTPEMNSSFNKYCQNFDGKLRVRPFYKGCLSNIGANVRQIFTRMEVTDPQLDPEVRFQQFRSTFATMRRGELSGTLIFVPSYLDFVKLRNYFNKDQDISSYSVSEYSSAGEISRARAYFADERTDMMLYTERLHHYRRYVVKGTKQILFYGLPENPLYYVEVCRFLVKTAAELDVDVSSFSVRVLFSKWDSAKLERIVGTEQVGIIMQATSDSFEYS